jgi:hypothetical protein
MNMRPVVAEELFLRSAVSNRKSIREIATELSCSRQNVWVKLKRYGIETSKAVRVDFICAGCGTPGRMLKTQFVKSELHFHGKSCYTKYQHSSEFREGRAAERIARVTLEDQNRKNRI